MNSFCSPLCGPSQYFESQTRDTKYHLRLDLADDRGAPASDPQSRIKSSFPDPEFALALAGIRRLVVGMQAIETDDLIPL